MLTFLQAFVLSVTPAHENGVISFGIQGAVPNSFITVYYSFDGQTPAGKLPEQAIVDSSGAARVGPFVVPQSISAGDILYFKASQRSSIGTNLGLSNGEQVTISPLPLPLPDAFGISQTSYLMGDHYGVGQNDEDFVHQVDISPMALSKTEVRNDEFSIFLNYGLSTRSLKVINYEVVDSQGVVLAQLRRAPISPRSDLIFNGYAIFPAPGKEAHPVVEVSWYGAVAYCDWLTQLSPLNEQYRLPTEAEWELFARDLGLWGYWKYHWAFTNNIDGSYANYGGLVGGTMPVGSYLPNGVDGFNMMKDMNGNVREWVSDWYDANYYQVSDIVDPQGPSSGVFKVVRGGSWDRTEINVRSAARAANNPINTNYDTGFRVAVTF